MTIFDRLVGLLRNRDLDSLASRIFSVKEMLIAIDQSGYQIVPKEPTIEMLEGARFSMMTWHDIQGSQLTINDEKAKIRYKAMLAKAPKVGQE
jgi:hypothetical protein